MIIDFTEIAQNNSSFGANGIKKAYYFMKNRIC